MKCCSAMALSERLTDLIQLRLQAEAAAAAEPDELMVSCLHMQWTSLFLLSELLLPSVLMVNLLHV